MKRTIVVVAVALSIIDGAAAAAGSKTSVVGSFTANADFATLVPTSVGANCLLEVEVELELTGTLTGVAAGPLRALVLGSCDDVGVTPPGTFKDVFRGDLELLGTVAGDPLIADLRYRGTTDVGGAIKARFHLSNGLQGVLKVDAAALAGGSYEGSLIVNPEGP